MSNPKATPVKSRFAEKLEARAARRKERAAGSTDQAELKLALENLLDQLVRDVENHDPESLPHRTSTGYNFNKGEIEFRIEKGSKEDKEKSLGVGVYKGPKFVDMGFYKCFLEEGEVIWLDAEDHEAESVRNALEDHIING
jgi:hypothetical protein